MNVYDFDGTVYHGDCSRDFTRFCFLRHPRLWLCLPRQGWAWVRRRFFGLPWRDAQAAFFCYLPHLPNADAEVAAFWAAHRGRLKGWYLAQKQPDDVFISASPAFLLEGLGTFYIIATELCPRTGHMQGESCWGAEKAARFARAFPGAVPDGFWSDHISDEPMARLARRAWFVAGETVTPWPFASGV